MTAEAESSWVLDTSRCPSCGICADVCPTGATQMTRDMAYPSFDEALCTYCHTCVDQCPFDALLMAPAEAETK